MSVVWSDNELMWRSSGMLQSEWHALRHNAIVYCLSKFATVARVPHRVECGSDPDSRARPWDLTQLHWKGQGPHYLDVTVTHPLSISSTWSSIHNGMECFDQGEKSKRQKYSGMIGNIE